ncbi:MAG: PHP domain-containing protein [Candidatus Omnitrophica bacterium]|nr:PHP domain-containing protein [Candidatus Omnitrophota bacterium]
MPSPTSEGKADLHLHTIYSDGTESPTRVVEMAQAAGLRAMAITDHDILDSYPEASSAAQARGIELIPGIEMSAALDGIEVHVLGFFLDLACQPLQQLLAEQRQRRIGRIREMVGRLQQLGLHLEADEVFAVAGPQGSVGRPHVAQALVKRGYVATEKEAFDRYIKNDGPAFVPGSSLSPKFVIQMIRQAGGIPALAHPIYLKDDALIERFTNEGLLGLEVYHSSHAPDVVQRYERIADELGLLKTGGSDYHGRGKEGAEIGSTTIPYSLVEALKAWKREQTQTSCESP